MTVGYTRKQFEEKFTELEKLDKQSEEYFYKYMRFLISFGRAMIITEKGVEKGKELYEKWKRGEELAREENMLCGFLCSDICILEEDEQMLIDVGELYEQMITKHKPDFGYLQSFCQEYVLQAGFTEPNPRYMETIERMFITDHIVNNPIQLHMINSGEMPLFKEIKICPYCGDEFNEKDLYKHVNTTHEKK